MDAPLTRWYCDHCHEAIDAPARAYVIWRYDAQQRDTDFRIIHQKQCDRKDFAASAPLADFLSTEGLTRLLSVLSYGPLKEGPNPGVGSIDEFVDFVRRCQVPYYEEARRKFREQTVQEYYADANEVLPYRPDSLQKIIEKL